MPWDIEKVFDELTNKLRQTKAWPKSATAKEIQGVHLRGSQPETLKTGSSREGSGNTTEIRRCIGRAGSLPTTE